MWRVRQWEDSRLLPFSGSGTLREEEQVPRKDDVVTVVDVELEKSVNIQVRKSRRQTRGQGWRREGPLEGRPKWEVSSLQAIVKLWLAL